MVDQTPQNPEILEKKRYAQRAGVSDEEYTKIRNYHGNDTKETNVWGRFYPMSRQECHERMWDMFSAVQQFRIPRTVAERLDISSNAKLVYGVLLCFPQGITMYRSEIAGMCGMSLYAAGLALGDLERAGLLKIKKQWRDEERTRRAPSYYFPIQPPNRFKGKGEPHFLSTNISNFEEVIRARFYDLESEC